MRQLVRFISISFKPKNFLRFSALLTWFSGILLFAGCGMPSVETAPYLSVQGETMGTYYTVTYQDPAGRNLQAPFDSILLVINQEVSTYIPTSSISQFNDSGQGLDLGFDYREQMYSSDSEIAMAQPPNYHFVQNYILSGMIYDQTGGAFDPTVMPLVNYWGFGYTGKEAVTAVDSQQVDSLQGFVGYDKVNYEATFLSKTVPGIKLDFSAVAKGYAVDVLGVFLESAGVKNYLVNIGGEVRARGQNDRGEAWQLGINTPSSEAGLTDYELIVSLQDRSMATSGNYRNYYEVDGVKYAHTINPATGFPERNALLSASVLAADCALADGLATACMVLGYEKARDLITGMEGVEACFIYGESDGSMGVFYTSGLTDAIRDAN